MAKQCASGVLAAAAYVVFGVDRTYADGTFNFSPFSNSSPATAPQAAPEPAAEPPTQPAEPRVRNNNPRTGAAGFDPEPLESVAKALRELPSSSNAKKVFTFGVLVLSILV